MKTCLSFWSHAVTWRSGQSHPPRGTWLMCLSPSCLCVVSEPVTAYPHHSGFYAHMFENTNPQFTVFLLEYYFGKNKSQIQVLVILALLSIRSYSGPSHCKEELCLNGGYACAYNQSQNLQQKNKNGQNLGQLVFIFKGERQGPLEQRTLLNVFVRFGS